MSRPGLQLALAVLSLGTACRPAAPTAAPAAAPATCPVLVPPARGPSRLAAAEQDLRTRGLAALDVGAWHHARRAFAAILAVVPDDLSALALHDAVTRAMLVDQQTATAALASARPLVVPAPPAQATVVRPAPVTSREPAPRLALIHTGPARTSDDEWQRTHCIALPEHQVPNPMRGDPGDVPPGTASLYGEHVLVQAIAGDDHTLLLYGPDYRAARFILVRSSRGERLAFLDLAAWLTATPGADPPAIAWAAVADATLYLSIHHPTAGYLAALDLRSGDLLWRSPPGLAGAADFVLTDAHILTATRARLVVLGRRTGTVVGEHPIDGDPLYLLARDRRLFVRSDAADHEFELR